MKDVKMHFMHASLSTGSFVINCLFLLECMLFLTNCLFLQECMSFLINCLFLLECMLFLTNCLFVWSHDSS